MKTINKIKKLLGISYIADNDTYSYSCKHCNHKDHSPCNAQNTSSKGTYVCTLPKGHKGKHRACGAGKKHHPIVKWN